MVNSASFFEYGTVNLVCHDNKSRQIALDLCMPCYLLQYLMPILLDGGLIDNYKLKNPIASWMPALSSDVLKENANQSYVNDLNKAITHHVYGILHLFAEVASVMKNPNDLVPMLPLGIYVTFRYRIGMDKFIDMMEKLKEYELYGAPEFRGALVRATAETVD